MSLTNEEYVDRLYESLQKKLVILDAVYNDTKEQASAIDRDDYESLNLIIDKKQEKIDAILKLEDEFEIYFKRLKANLNVKSLDEIKALGIRGGGKLKEKVEEIVYTIAKIKEGEKENLDKSNAALEEIKNIINRLKLSKKANNAYVLKSDFETESYFFDSKK